MFEFPSGNLIQDQRNRLQAQMLGSFHSEDPNTKASLIKGLTIDEFEVSYPSDQYERFSFSAIQKVKEDIKKANENDLQKTETQSKEVESVLSPVVVQHGEMKKLVYVRKKA